MPGHILRTRFVDYQKFHEMITRLHKEVRSDEVAYLFLLLQQTRDISNIQKSVIDLMEFIAILKLSKDDSRRSYSNKTSQIANNVEFWGDKNGNSTQRPHTAHARFQRSSTVDTVGTVDTDQNTKAGNRPYSSSGKQRSKGDKNDTVAETMGRLDRQSPSKANGGRMVLGCLSQEFAGESVAFALHSPVRPVRPHSSSARNSSSQKTYKYPQFSLDPKEMQAEMERGIAVPQLLRRDGGAENACRDRGNLIGIGGDWHQATSLHGGGGSTHPNPQDVTWRRASSVGQFHNEFTNKTTVASALGK